MGEGLIRTTANTKRLFSCKGAQSCPGLKTTFALRPKKTNSGPIAIDGTAAVAAAGSSMWLQLQQTHGQA